MIGKRLQNMLAVSAPEEQEQQEVPLIPFPPDSAWGFSAGLYQTVV